MTTRLLALMICGGTISAASFADEKAADEKKTAVIKELDAAGVPRVLERGDVNKPAAITTAQELARAIPVEEVQARLKKAVDFRKQQVLFFAWSGSGGDQLACSVEMRKNGPEVIFEYRRGLQKNLVPHVRLFAIPKDATWKVQTAK
jgi:hypothetical protein